MRVAALPLPLKRTAAIVLSFLLISTVLLRQRDSITLHAPWTAISSAYECPDHRAQSFYIEPPGEGNRELRSEIWSRLRLIFEANQPVPFPLKHSRPPKAPTKDTLDTYFNLTQEDAKLTRDRHQQVLEAISPYPQKAYHGRGVVLVAGGRYTEFAVTSIGMLREARSKLPVEVWYVDDTEGVPGWCEHELADQGVACRKLSDYMDISMLEHRYAYKAFSMLFSSFREILFLDADNNPLVGPERLFESKIYRERGAILWPDYWKHTGSPWLPYLIGVTDEKSDMWADEQSTESGQMLWDKKRHWKSLVLSVYYNYYGPQFWYTAQNNHWMGWGDKDTFPTALKAAKEVYFQVKHPIVTGQVDGLGKGVAMLQADPANEDEHVPVFLHSNLVKWSMRNLACAGDCLEMPGHRQIWHQLDVKSEVHANLHEGRRIFAMEDFDRRKIDPEPILWKQIEWAACYSRIWGVASACNRTRTYMQDALGYEFRPLSTSPTSNQTCLIKPAAFKRPS